MGYSDVQLQAIKQHEGQLLLISCPGSGKTTTVIGRTIDMISSGIDASSILVVTFTKSAAEEMKLRYERKIKELGIHPNGEADFRTIHSLCFGFLVKIGYPFNIMDNKTKVDMMRSTVNELTKKGVLKSLINDYEEFLCNCLSEISAVKNNIYYHDWGTYKPSSCRKLEFKSIFDLYTKKQKEAGVIDFDDMLLIAYEEAKKGKINLLRQKYRYITVDEYQDTNFIQRDFIYLIGGDKPNLCVVGDDDQSIYQFRGAKPEVMLGFRDHFKDATVLKMSVNYRSDKSIIQKSKRLIENNKERFDKDIEGSSSKEGFVNIKECTDRAGELKFIFKEIENLTKKGKPLSDIAVLTRNNKEVQAVIRECIVKKIPFYSQDKITTIYNHWIYKNILNIYYLANDPVKIASVPDAIRSVLRNWSYVNPDYGFLAYYRFPEFDLKSMERVIKYSGKQEWVIKKNLENLRLFYRRITRLKSLDQKSFFDKLEKECWFVNALKAYAEEKILDEEDLTDVFYRCKEDAVRCTSFDAFFVHADNCIMTAERINKENQKNKENGLKVYTMHGSKGLEWDTVFVAFVNDNIIPSKHSRDAKGIEEERRLFYVAITRAKHNLYISCNKEKSKFIDEIKDVPVLKTVTKKAIKKWGKGIVFVHERYGRCTVLKVEQDNLIVKPEKTIGAVKIAKPLLSTVSLSG